MTGHGTEKDAGDPCAFFPACPGDDGYVCMACLRTGRVLPPVERER